MIEIKTPVFKGPNRSPARLIGTASGYIDPGEVVGITSAMDLIQDVTDSRDSNGERGKAKTGNMFSLLTFRGGRILMVMGTPEETKKMLDGDALAGVEAAAEASA